MNEVKVKTTLHCDGCISKVKPILDSSQKVKNWNIDFENGSAILKASGVDISKSHLNQLLNQAGYSVIEGGKFWSDSSVWKRASFNTLNCLIGCSVGDFGMVIFLQAFYPATSIAWQMALAIIAGLFTSVLLETFIMRFRESFNWGAALKTALGMSFISMIAMEIAMTSTDFMITGGKASFSDWWYWAALAPALMVGFLTPLPYNYWRLKKFNQSCH